MYLEECDHACGSARMCCVVVMFVIKLDTPIVAHEKTFAYFPSPMGILMNPSAIAKIKMLHMMMLVIDHFLLISPSNRSVPHKQPLYDVHCIAL